MKDNTLYYYRDLNNATPYLVPVNTVFLKIVPFKELPVKLARSTIAFEKSAPSKLDSICEKASDRCK